MERAQNPEKLNGKVNTRKLQNSFVSRNFEIEVCSLVIILGCDSLPCIRFG